MVVLKIQGVFSFISSFQLSRSFPSFLEPHLSLLLKHHTSVFLPPLWLFLLCLWAELSSTVLNKYLQAKRVFSPEHVLNFPAIVFLVCSSSFPQMFTFLLSFQANQLPYKSAQVISPLWNVYKGINFYLSLLYLTFQIYN